MRFAKQNLETNNQPFFLVTGTIHPAPPPFTPTNSALLCQ